MGPQLSEAATLKSPSINFTGADKEKEIALPFSIAYGSKAWGIMGQLAEGGVLIEVEQLDKPKFDSDGYLKAVAMTSTGKDNQKIINATVKLPYVKSVWAMLGALAGQEVELVMSRKQLQLQDAAPTPDLFSGTAVGSKSKIAGSIGPKKKATKKKRAVRKKKATKKTTKARGKK